MTKDPYRYFRVEARELLEGLTKGALELERHPLDTPAVGNLLRLAHTLKGAARVVKQPGIAELAHAMEGLLSPYREGQSRVPRECTAEMLRLTDQITAQLAALEAPADAGTSAQAAPATEESLETLRVNIEEVEFLLRSLAEASAQITALEAHTASLRRARRLAGRIAEQLAASPQRDPLAGRSRSLAEQLADLLRRLEGGLPAGIAGAEKDLAQARDEAYRLRLLPAAVVLPALSRAVRDAAVTLGKQAELDLTGGDVRLDAHVLAVLRDALLHVVRNAVAHGIETPEARTAAGKPPGGRVGLAIERRGNHVAFICQDDGRGIDLAAIRRAAVKVGAIPSAEAETLGLDEAIQLILRGGITTTATVTGISGRGIGLDAVRETVRRLKGAIAIQTVPGRGTTVDISVPVSLISVPILKVESAGMVVSIPLDAVRRIVSVTRQEIARSGASQAVAFEGRAIPFLRLSQALRPETPAAHRERSPAVVIVAGEAMAAIGVERLLGTGTVLVRGLPALAAVGPEVAGACLDAEGLVQLVLDPAGLLTAACARQEPRLPPAQAARPPILVVDDSLTTRMLEQSILESAGYEVELAMSGEEALDKARQRRYGLFLVDIEMPGMDGFEFLSRTRSDARIPPTPSILVTSRNSAEDRRRGEELGSSAYIVKSEFDQANLLRTIRQVSVPS